MNLPTKNTNGYSNGNMKFTLAYPVFPIHLNQSFGSNPAYYARFLDDNGNPVKGHSGIDFQAIHGQPVYAAHDGTARTVGPDEHGGQGVYIKTNVPDNNGKYWNTIYWHLVGTTDPKFPQPFQGLKAVKKGDLIGYANNTGAPFESTGDHLHFGLAECDQYGNFRNRSNGFNGCQDSQPFFDGTYATDEVINTPPPAVNIALLASQKAQSGNLTIANMLYAIVGIIRAWWVGDNSTRQN